MCAVDPPPAEEALPTVISVARSWSRPRRFGEVASDVALGALGVLFDLHSVAGGLRDEPADEGCDCWRYGAEADDPAPDPVQDVDAVGVAVDVVGWNGVLERGDGDDGDDISNKCAAGLHVEQGRKHLSAVSTGSKSAKSAREAISDADSLGRDYGTERIVPANADAH